MHWLPKRLAASLINAGCFTAALLMLTLSAPASKIAHVVDRTNTAAHGERDKDRVGYPAHHVDHNVARLMCRCYVKKNKLVGAFAVVNLGLRHGIAGIDQVDKVDTLDYAPVLDV